MSDDCLPSDGGDIDQELRDMHMHSQLQQRFKKRQKFAFGGGRLKKQIARVASLWSEQILFAVEQLKRPKD